MRVGLGPVLSAACLLACGRLPLFPTGEIGTPVDGGLPDASLASADAGPCVPPNEPAILNPGVLPPAVIGAGYSVAIGATAGPSHGGITFSLISGQVPPGLALSLRGNLQGSPTGLPVPNPALFAVQARDDLACVSEPGWFELLVDEVPPSPCVVAPESCDAGPTGLLQIATSSVPAAPVGMIYETGFSAVGGTVPYVFTVASGRLPPGFSLSPTGLLTGVSEGPLGTFVFVVEVTDGIGSTAYSSPIELQIE